jgi:hypothetical protein
MYVDLHIVLTDPAKQRVTGGAAERTKLTNIHSGNMNTDSFKKRKAKFKSILNIH